MKFIKSESMKIQLLKHQENQLSSKERMRAAFLDPNVLSFDIYHQNIIIGFIMVKKFDDKSYFLWNYAIDYKYQNQQLGYKALVEFIKYMSNEYDMKVMTTTYLYDNLHAKKLYEKIGFVQTDIVDEVGCHEVNMIYRNR